jgi:hypothetical protein
MMSRQKLIWIFWPSFIVGGIAEGIFFTVFDPMEMSVFGDPVTWSRTAVYSIGFFAFWAVAAASSAMTCFFQKSAAEINQCPIDDPMERPPGCPRRGEGGCC